MENKMTHAKAIEWVLKNVNNVPTDVKEHLEAIQTSISKRNSYKSDKPTKAQRENIVISDKLYAGMTIGKQYTITDIIKTVDGMSDYTNQKITALMSKLVDDGKVERLSVKGKALYIKVA